MKRFLIWLLARYVRALGKVCRGTHEVTLLIHRVDGAPPDFLGWGSRSNGELRALHLEAAAAISRQMAVTGQAPAKGSIVEVVEQCQCSVCSRRRERTRLEGLSN